MIKITSNSQECNSRKCYPIHPRILFITRVFTSIYSNRSLAEACSDGDIGTVRKLLDEGRSVHETTEEGESLLSLACSAGYYELAQVRRNFISYLIITLPLHCDVKILICHLSNSICLKQCCIINEYTPKAQCSMCIPLTSYNRRT